MVKIFFLNWTVDSKLPESLGILEINSSQYLMQFLSMLNHFKDFNIMIPVFLNTETMF